MASTLCGRVALVVGLAFWWPFFRRFEYAALFADYDDSSLSMWVSYAPTMLLLAFLFGVGTFACQRVEQALDRHRSIFAACGMLGIVGYLLILVAPTLWQDPDVAAVLGGAFVAVGYASLTACWGATVAGVAPRLAAGSLMLAFALSTTLQLVSFLPEGVVAAMAVATPALSAAAWLLTPRPSCFDALYGRAALRSLPLSVLGMFGAFLVAGRIAVGLLAYAPDSIFPFERLLSVGCAVAMVAVLFTMAGGAAKAGWGRTVRVAWAVLAIAFMAGMFLLFAGDDVLSHVGTGVLSAILGCFEMALFVILALAVYAARASGVFAFCAATLLFRLVPHAVGKGLAPVMMAADSSWTDQVVALAVPAMTFLLVAATIVFMNGRAMEDGWLGALSGVPESMSVGSENVVPTSRASILCQCVAAEAGLTPREVDVLVLMGEGRSYQRIADSLGISLGTVQGYVKAVYRKLGVHTRQEVIDLVSRR